MPTRDIVLIALFAAIMAVLGVFPPFVLPLIGVPITAQSMGVMLAGSILGARRGGLAVALFVGLVAMGMPLLAGGRGGIGVIAGPGGGFILAWPLAAFAVGWLCERNWHKLGMLRAGFCNIVGGIFVLYPFGIAWISAVAGVSLWEAAVGSLAFIPGDIIKAVVAAAVAVTVRRSYPLIEAPSRA